MRHAIPRSLTALCALTVLFAARPAAAQADIALDPYRAVESQQIRPNINLIIDHSSLMISDIRGNRYPATYTGEVTGGSWRCIQNNDVTYPAGFVNCSSTRRRWMYFGPSRLAEVKNVLGLTPVVDYSSFNNPNSCTTNASCGAQTAPAPSAQPAQNLVYSAAFTETRFNAGLVDFTTGTENATLDVLANSATAASQCDVNRVVNHLRPATALPVAESSLPGCSLTATATIAPLLPGAGPETATSSALNLSGYAHQAVTLGTAITAGSLCPANGSISQTVPAPAAADPKSGCGRPLFNVLITGDASSTCNSGYVPSSTCPAATAGPAAGSPMQTADRLYRGILADGSSGPSQRTFVIGVGTTVAGGTNAAVPAINAAAKMEMNLIAYFGRTDANDIYKLGGVRLVQAYDTSGAELCVGSGGTITPCTATITTRYQLPADPYLRLPTDYVLDDNQNSVGVTCVSVTLGGVTFRLCPGRGFDCTHDYAYFAADRAELKMAANLVFGALTTGDFTTQLPVISELNSIDSAGTQRSYIYTASTSFPNFQGHLRAQNLEVCITPDGTPVLCSDPRAVGFLQEWDAGQLLAKRVELESYAGSTRRIYMPDTSVAYNTVGGYWPLVKIDSATSTTTLSTLFQQMRPTAPCNPSCVDADMLKFMVGYYTDSSGVTRPRQWIMGDVMGSDPVVLSRPGTYGQGVTYSHDVPFANTYSDRRPLILQATSSGVLHAFDAGTGKEDWAFIPPDALPAIYDQFQNFKNGLVMGQPADTNLHIYGMNGGLNFTDVDLRQPDSTVVYNPTTLGYDYAPVSDWRTLLAGGLGKGGRAVFALDVTHSNRGSASTTTFPTMDPNYGVGNGCASGCTNSPNFQVLWYKSANYSAGAAALPVRTGETWSTPSISLDNYQISVSSTPTRYPAGRWIVSFGSGPVSSLTGSTNANNFYSRGVHLYHLSAKDGALVKYYQLGGGNGGGVLASTTLPNTVAYASHNIDFADAFKDRFYQADTAGRLWEINTGLPGPFGASSAPPGVNQLESSTWPGAPAVNSTELTPMSLAGDPAQPVFYSPAAIFYKDDAFNDHPIQMLTWPGGNYIEDGGVINNPACTTCFVPKLFFRAHDLAATPASSDLLTAPYLTSFSYLKGATTLTYTDKARVIASPSAYVPVLLNAAGTVVTDWPLASSVRVLYTVYDPGQGTCTGDSSVLVFKPFGDNATASSSSGFGAAALSGSTGTFAAEGMTSGAIVFNGQIIVNMSSRYQNAAARIAGLEAAAGSGGVSANVVLVAWREIY